MKTQSAHEQGQLIWKDRKRILGLPISFTRYSIAGNRLYVKKGLFSTTENELLLYRVLDISLKRTLGDRMVGVGSITLFTADQTDKELYLRRIKHPQQVRDLISRMVEEEREKRRMVGREMYGVAGTIEPADLDGDGLPG